MAKLITKTKGITEKKEIQLIGFETGIDKTFTILFNNTKQIQISIFLDCEEAEELQDYIKHPVTNIDDEGMDTLLKTLSEIPQNLIIQK